MANPTESSNLTSSEGQPSPVDSSWDSHEAFGKEAGGKRREITGVECRGHLGYDFPTWKKWAILSVIFVVQVSMVRPQ